LTAGHIAHSQREHRERILLLRIICDLFARQQGTQNRIIRGGCCAVRIILPLFSCVFIAAVCLSRSCGRAKLQAAAVEIVDGELAETERCGGAASAVRPCKHTSLAVPDNDQRFIRSAPRRRWRRRRGTEMTSAATSKCLRPGADTKSQAAD